MPENLGFSTNGQRRHKLDVNDTIHAATKRVLYAIEQDSSFFDQVEPYKLPTFESSEIDHGAFLGKGEFGEVWEIQSIHIEFDCPCDTCGISDVDDTLTPLVDNTDEVSDRGSSAVEIIVDESLRKLRKEESNKDAPKTSSISMPSALNKHKRATSSVSFAQDVKMPESPEGPEVSYSPSLAVIDPAAHNFIEDDNTTLSSADEEQSMTQMMKHEQPDGEATFLRGYMSTHSSRHGIARYATKRARSDLKPDELLEAAVDLAVEAKFLATIRHTNIVRMRGTVGIAGDPNFMIIMDRLRMTLREKMDLWKNESKGKTGILSKFLGNGGNQAVHREQYADKLLAVYDIARAMRYLHNHMIIYRDLKPENIAVDVRGDMRIFDFGLVKELKKKDLIEAPDGFAATGLTGSRRYMAPEVCSCKNYGLKADVYSFSIVFWEIFSGQEAYSKMSFDKHFDQIVVKGKRPSTKLAVSNTKHLSKSLQHLIPDMWHANPSERPTFKNICDRLAGECLLSSTRPPRGKDSIRDSDQSHQSFLTDRTRYLMNQSLRSRYASDLHGDSSSSTNRGGAEMS